MDCVIKIVSGPEAGQEFTCSGAETLIGRSQRCAIRLGAASISYEHAIIARTGDEFFIENLSANGTFLNNERVAARTRLRARDQIRLGDETALRVESVPVASGGGSSRRYLLIGVVAMLVVLAAVVVMDPFSESASFDWPKAYMLLQDFTEKETAAGKLPAEMPRLMQDAWRFEAAGDRKDASRAWVRLQVRLATTDGENGFESASSDHPKALANLLKPGSDGVMNEEEMGAALVEFVGWMEKRK